MPNSETDGPSEALKPSRNRVLVLAEVVNTADELALVSKVCRTRGWTARPPQDGEVSGYPEQGRTWLVIEVRFPGSTRSAVKQAVKRIEDVTEQFQLGLWVRFAQIVDFPKERWNLYYINQAEPKRLAAFRTARTTGMIILGTRMGEQAVRDRLALINLGEPFDAARHSIRPALSWSILDDPTGAPTDAAKRTLMVVAGAGGVAVCGFAAGLASGAWRVIPVLAGLSVSALLVGFLSGDQSRRQRLARVVPFGIVLGASAVLAILTPHKDVRLLVAAAAGLGAAVLVGRGVLLAVRDSWLTKQASWIIPFVLTALAPLALSLGGIYDDQYLDSRFGIPSNSISIPAIYRIAIAGRPVLIGLCFTTIFVGVIGYFRYFHQFSDGSRWMPLLSSSVTLGIYLLASLSIGLTAAAHAADSAAAAARAGRQPGAYFGIVGVLDCIRPVADVIPVYNAPLPTGRPLLSFGTATTSLWLWDPGTERAIEVPLGDVVVTPATGTPARCG
jgi:hypothetical protein